MGDGQDKVGDGTFAVLEQDSTWRGLEESGEVLYEWKHFTDEQAYNHSHKKGRKEHI